MLNKSIAFGLLAAGLMIVPNAAFAGDSQSNVQETVQEASAFDGSAVIQTSRSSNVQNQTRYQGGRRTRYGGYCGGGSNQAQSSVQSTRQAGAAEAGSVVDQNSNSTNRQNQAVRRGRC